MMNLTAVDESRKCKQCGYPVGGCDNPVCANAHAQGFCGTGCRDAYFAIKEWELTHARKTA